MGNVGMDDLEFRCSEYPWSGYNFNTWSGTIAPCREKYMYAVMEKVADVAGSKKCPHCGSDHTETLGSQEKVVCYADTLEAAREMKERSLSRSRFIRKIKYEEVE